MQRISLESLFNRFSGQISNRLDPKDIGTQQSSPVSITSHKGFSDPKVSNAVATAAEKLYEKTGAEAYDAVLRELAKVRNNKGKQVTATNPEEAITEFTMISRGFNKETGTLYGIFPKFNEDRSVDAFLIIPIKEGQAIRIEFTIKKPGPHPSLVNSLRRLLDLNDKSKLTEETEFRIAKFKSIEEAQTKTFDKADEIATASFGPILSKYLDLPNQITSMLTKIATDSSGGWMQPYEDMAIDPYRKQHQ